MSSDHLVWELFAGSKWYLYFGVLFLVVFCAVIFSNEMRRRNKIIFATISLVALLFLPVGHKLAIQKQVEDKGYHLIVGGGVVWQQYKEVQPREDLWFPIFAVAKINEDYKLVYVERGKYNFPPQTLDKIEFT